MRKALIILLAIAPIPLFYFVTRSIMDVTMLQLRHNLTRERMLNYELSSKVLEARFRRMLANRDNVSNEIKINVLESSIMNSDATVDNERFTPQQLLGLYIVNGVRLLSLKSLLHLSEDQEKLLLLQYAFYMERNRRYDVATQKYSQLESLLTDADRDDRGFVLLHNGYCLAMMGNNAKALEKLHRVLQVNGGSHYETTANLLISLLNERKSRSQRIEKEFQNNRERGLAYYREGQYSTAVKQLEKEKDLRVGDRFILSRAYEETGRMKNAVDGYVELTQQKEDEDVARKANRRLMMIGSFYGGGKEVSQYAEQKAVQMGDQAVLTQVKEGAELQLKPIVVEKVEKKKAEEKKSQEQAQGEEVASDKEEPLETLTAIEQEMDTSLKLSDKTIETISHEVKHESPPEKTAAQQLSEKKAARLPEGGMPGIYVEFVDGRRIVSKKLEWKDNDVEMKSDDFSISLPVTMVTRVGLDLPEGKSEGYHIAVILNNGRRVNALQIRREGEKLILLDQSGQEFMQLVGGIRATVVQRE